MMFSWGHESNGKWADVGCDATVILDRKMIPLCERTPNQCPSKCQPAETSECQDATVSLPNARFASSVLHKDLDDPEVKVTALLTLLGLRSLENTKANGRLKEEWYISVQKS